MSTDRKRFEEWAEVWNRNADGAWRPSWSITSNIGEACWAAWQAATHDSAARDAADLLESLARLCSTQGEQLLKDAARDAAKVASRLRRALHAKSEGQPERDGAEATRPDQPKACPFLIMGDKNAAECIASGHCGCGAAPVARLLYWAAPAHIPVPHGGVCARTYAEFRKGAGENGGYWKEGEPLYTHPPGGLDSAREALAARLCDEITGYLATGGLFNPEMANHNAVRDLLIECRAALTGGKANARPEGGS